MKLVFVAMAIFLMAGACTSALPDGETDVDKLFSPCDVTYANDTPADVLKWADLGRYRTHGAYPVWTTAPAAQCTNNPTISTGGFVGTQMHITYPSASDPLKTGHGRVADGTFPVIVFAHAKNDRTPVLFESYQNLHSHWASYGFLVVSVDQSSAADAASVAEDFQIRSDLQIDGLDEIRRLNSDPTSVFFKKVETDSFVFAGHSRGGAATRLSAASVPGVAGVILLQAVTSTTAENESTDFPVLAFTAGNDSDLDYPACEPTEDLLDEEYTWVNLTGGIHAYATDTVPARAEDEPEISREEQQTTTAFFSTAFLHRTFGLNNDWPAKSSEDILFSHAGSQFVENESLSKMGVFTRWRRTGDSKWVDTFDGTDPDTNLLGGENEFFGLTAVESATYQPDTNPTSGTYSLSYSLRLIAESTGTYRTEVDDLLVPSSWALEARIKGPDSGANASAFFITLKLEEARSQRVDALEFAGPMSLSNRFTQVHIPMAKFGLSSEDEIEAIEIEISDGELFVDDLRFVSPN